MITDWFYSLVSGLLSGIAALLPAPPSWWPTGGISIPLMGVVDASVVNGVLVAYLAVLVAVPTVKLVRRAVSHMTGGGGAL